MKFKIEKQPAIVEEIEVEFPIHRKLGKCNYYRCVSESNVICVSDYGDKNYAISIDSYIVEGNVFNVNSMEITEQEFNDKFNEVLTKIKNIA